MSLHGSAVDILTDWDAPDPAQDSLRHAVLAFLAARPDGCLRSCVPGHVTASALVLDHTGTHTVLTLHPGSAAGCRWADTASPRTRTSSPPRCARPVRSPASTGW